MGENDRSLMAVFAHPDDESFGPSATLAKYASQSVKTYLVCATRGEAGKVGEEGAVLSREELGRKVFKPEQIIGKLREAEVLLSQGHKRSEVSRKLGITEQTYYRWRK